MVLNTIFISVEVLNKKAKAGLQKTQQQVNTWGKKIQQNFKKIQNLGLGLGLSLLFTSMAINRAATSALRAIFNTAQIAYGEVSEFNILTNKLTANWEFFKFTLVDALMQSGLFQSFIGFLINITQFLAGLSPRTKRFGIIILGIVAALSASLMVLGQVFLGLLAPITLVGTVGSASLIPILVAVGLIIGVIIALGIIWSSNMSNSAKVTWSLFAAVAAVAIGVLGISAPLLLVIGIIAALIFAVTAWKKHWRDALGNMKLLALNVWYNITLGFEKMLNTIISGLNAIIRAMNMIPGVSIGTIGSVDFSSGAFDTLMANVRSEQARRAESQSTVNNDISITQQAGEDAEALAQRVMEEINRTMTSSLGSTQMS